MSKQQNVLSNKSGMFNTKSKKDKRKSKHSRLKLRTDRNHYQNESVDAALNTDKLKDNTEFNKLDNHPFPKGLASTKYYDDFQRLVQKFCVETLDNLYYVFTSSKSNREDLVRKLADYKKNYTLIAEN